MSATAFQDFLLDGDSDLATVAGDLVPATGLEGIAQAADIALEQTGSDFMRPLNGIDYRRKLFGAVPLLTEIRGDIVLQLRRVAGIVEVVYVVIAPDYVTRRASVAWKARTDYGDLDRTTEVAV